MRLWKRLYHGVRILDPDALVAPKVNDLYTRKSTHIVDRIQRMQRINEIAIVIGAPVMWAFLSAVGIPYTSSVRPGWGCSSSGDCT